MISVRPEMDCHGESNPVTSQLIDGNLTTRPSKPFKSSTNSAGEPSERTHPETQFKMSNHSNTCDWLTHVARSSNFHSLNDRRRRPWHVRLPPLLSLHRGVVAVLTSTPEELLDSLLRTDDSTEEQGEEASFDDLMDDHKQLPP
jgi:hypothetical protein